MVADLICLAVVVTFVSVGYKRGLMKSLLGLVSSVAAIILSFMLYPVISSMLAKTPLFEFLVNAINENYIKGSAFDEGGALAVFAKYLGSGVQSGLQNPAEAIARLLLNIVSFVVVIIAGKVIIKLVGNTLDLFAKLPVIKQFNRLGGAVLGGLGGVLILYIVFAVVVFVSPFDAGSKIHTEIEDSVVALELYENNLLLNLLSGGGIM